MAERVKWAVITQCDCRVCGPHGQAAIDAGYARSLRDLDLRTRLFRFRCSYPIYSESFDQLPVEVRTHVLRRLHAVLVGNDDSEMYAHLGPGERRTIVEILRRTKPGLPDEWLADD